MQVNKAIFQRRPQPGLIHGAGGRKAKDYSESLSEVHHGDCWGHMCLIHGGLHRDKNGAQCHTGPEATLSFRAVSNPFPRGPCVFGLMLESTYPGNIYSDSHPLVLPCHLRISKTYELADMAAAREISHLYFPVLKRSVKGQLMLFSLCA